MKSGWPAEPRELASSGKALQALDLPVVFRETPSPRPPYTITSLLTSTPNQLLNLLIVTPGL